MGDRECLGAGTARLFAGFVRPDAVRAEADRAALELLGDALAREHVPLLRGVGPVLVINTVVVVAAAQRRLVRRRRDEGPQLGGGPSYLRVPRVSGGFTPSTRLVSRNDGREWFLFGF